MNHKLWILMTVSFLLIPFGIIRAQQDNKDLKLHIEVRVELNNESELEGIVVDGRFYEKYDLKKNRWKTMPSRKGAGLRLWHVEKAEGFIYLDYETDIHRIEEIGKKTQGELDQLRDEIARQKELRDKQREIDLANEAKTTSENPETTKDGNPETAKTEEIDAQKLNQYEEILGEFDPANFNLNKMVQAVKVRMNSGVPLSTQHKEFLTKYPLWREAVNYKNQVPPIKDVTEAQLTEAQELMEKYPTDLYNLDAKVQKLSVSALNEQPMVPSDEEWLMSLDKWLDAQIIIKIAAEKKETKEGID